MIRLALLSAAILGTAVSGWTQSSVSFDFSRKSRQPAQAERRLQRWVRDQPELRQRLDTLAWAGTWALSANETRDLRDAAASFVGQEPDGLLPRPATRPRALDACRTLRDCPKPFFHVDVEDPLQFPEAIGALLRPWLLAQHAHGRGLELSVAPANGEGRLLDISARNLMSPGTGLYVAQLGQGRYRLRLDGKAELGELFAEARQAAPAFPR